MSDCDTKANPYYMSETDTSEIIDTTTHSVSVSDDITCVPAGSARLPSQDSVSSIEEETHPQVAGEGSSCGGSEMVPVPTITNNTIRRSGTTRDPPSFRWLMTLNNPTPEEVESVKQWLPRGCKQWILGEEEGHEEHTHHIHCYCSLITKARLTTMKKIQPRAHWDKWNDNDPSLYFSKMTILSEQMKDKAKAKVELEEVIEFTRENGLEACRQQYPTMYIRHWRALQQFLEEERKHLPKEKPTVYWLYGISGGGKTRWATETFPDHVIITQAVKGSVWFDGYDGQECVILDDIRNWTYRYAFLLQLLDRYKMRVPVKGGYKEWLPKYIIITCPWSPNDLWGKCYRNGELEENDQFAQLMRRLDWVYEFAEGTYQDRTDRCWSEANLNPVVYGREWHIN